MKVHRPVKLFILRYNIFSVIILNPSTFVVSLTHSQQNDIKTNLNSWISKHFRGKLELRCGVKVELNTLSWDPNQKGIGNGFTNLGILEPPEMQGRPGHE